MKMSTKAINQLGSTNNHKFSAVSTKQPHNKQPPNSSQFNSYLKLSNQEILIRNLRLVGIEDGEYFKQTKLKLGEDDIFPKNQVNPSSSKPFFYLTFICIKNILKEDQLSQISMWYPPRTVNQQLEYKKVFWKILKNLENSSKVPKNILMSKTSIMGDTNGEKLLQFLRFLSELALRQQYIQRYSHMQRLIQITSPGYSYPPLAVENEIDRFYTYPFVSSISVDSSKLPSQEEIKPIIKIYESYIQIYLKKISKLRINQMLCTPQLPHQEILCKLTEQKQLHSTLKQRIPAKILSQNRAFDRRRIIEKNQEIWEQLQKFNGYFLDKEDIPVIKLEGQIDQLLAKWTTAKGIANITQANSLLDIKTEQLKKAAKNYLQNFSCIKQRITQKLKIQNTK